MSDDVKASPVEGDVRRGWVTELDEKRSILATDLGDGTFGFAFKNGENTTRIRLSREAVNAMKSLMLHELGGIDV